VRDPTRAQENASRKAHATRQNGLIAWSLRKHVPPSADVCRLVTSAERVDGGWRLVFACGHVCVREHGVGPSGRAVCPTCSRAAPAKLRDAKVEAAKPAHVREAERYCLCAGGADAAVGTRCASCGLVVG